MAFSRTNLLGTPHTENNVDPATPSSWTMDIDGSADLLVVWISTGFHPKTIASIEVDPGGAAAAMTLAADSLAGATDMRPSLWYLASPPTGVGIEIAATVTSSSTELIAVSAAYSGADTASPLRQAVTENFTTPVDAASDIVDSENDDLVVDIMVVGLADVTGSLASDAGQTDVITPTTYDFGAHTVGISEADAPGDPSTTMGWSWTGVEEAKIVVASFKAAAGGATPTAAGGINRGLVGGGLINNGLIG